MNTKASVDEIRARFDADVERFSNLETGQSATMDAPLALELVTAAAARVTPHARDILDVGCGAGNYTLKLLQRLPRVRVQLVDLSRPMLDRAIQRIRAAGCQDVSPWQGDVRDADLGIGTLDVILAASVLHHLRTDEEWRSVFGKFHAALRHGGSLWVFDLVDSESPAVRELMAERYAEYLESVGGRDYRDRVFAYIEREDTPRSLAYQVELLREVGFQRIDVLHKQACYAAFGAVR